MYHDLPKKVLKPVLANALEKRKNLKSAFDSLSLSCQREYTEYIAEAKREETKLRRLEKILPMIEAAKGLHDKYR